MTRFQKIIGGGFNAAGLAVLAVALLVFVARPAGDATEAMVMVASWVSIGLNALGKMQKFLNEGEG